VALFWNDDGGGGGVVYTLLFCGVGVMHSSSPLCVYGTWPSRKACLALSSIPTNDRKKDSNSATHTTFIATTQRQHLLYDSVKHWH